MTRMLVAALITLGDPGRLSGGYLYHRRMAEAAPRHGARLELVDLPDWPFPLPTLAWPSVLRKARSLGAQILVLDSIAAAFGAPWLAGRRLPMPLVAMLHQPPGGIDHGRIRSMLQSGLDRLAYRHCRLLMLASEALAEQALAEGVTPDRARVVPPGRDVAEAQGSPPGDLRQGRRAAFLCVGNWMERKGIHSLLEAFARLPDNAATLHMAGDDQAQPGYARRIRARLARPDLSGRVVVHGPLPLASVAALYQSADVFVLPSLKEPYGTVYGEAMAFGLPVVGWRAGNLPYLADHEREGLILQPGDVSGLARAMERLASDEVLRRGLGEAGRQRARGRPTWEDSAGLFFTVLREVLAAPPRRRGVRRRCV